MSTCKNCGTNLSEEEKACPNCGTEVEENKNITEEVTVLENDSFDKDDISKNKLMAVLSYFSILVLVPLFGAPKSKFAHFHARQGVNLLLLEIIYCILSSLSNLFKTTKYIYGIAYKSTPWFVSLILSVFSIFIGVLAIIGVVNAVSGKAKKLPVIGDINIIK